MKSLPRDHRFLLVHGGGAEVTLLSDRLGIASVFKDGVRQTSAEEMDIVEMVLAGKVNKRLVRLLRDPGPRRSRAQRLGRRHLHGAPCRHPRQRRGLTDR